MSREELKQTDVMRVHGVSHIARHGHLVFDVLHSRINIVNLLVNKIQMTAKPTSALHSDWLYITLEDKMGVFRGYSGYAGPQTKFLLANWANWLPFCCFCSDEKRLQHASLFNQYEQLFHIACASRPTPKEKATFRQLLLSIETLRKDLSIFFTAYDHVLHRHGCELMEKHGSLGLFSMESTEATNKDTKRIYKRNTGLKEEKCCQLFQFSFLDKLIHL